MDRPFDQAYYNRLLSAVGCFFFTTENTAHPKSAVAKVDTPSGDAT